MAVVAVWGVMAWFVLETAARAYFVGGPSAMGWAEPLGALSDHVIWLSPAIWGASILAPYGGYRLLFKFPLALWLAGFALWMASWHLGLIVISIAPERGYHELIPSLKTGWMIPFCVAAVGLPILTLKPERSEQGSAD